MKKFLTAILALFLILSLVSCADIESIDTTGSAQTTETSETTETAETTEIRQPEAIPGANAYYPVSDAFTQTPLYTVFVNGGEILYCDKLTGERKIFCFDPLCEHADHMNCIALKFHMADSGLQSIEYCAYNNRFYALRGAQFCSFAIDGTDLRVEASFGEDGKFGSDKHGVYLYGATVDLSVQGKHVYFLANNGETGKKMLMRFDAENGTLQTVYHHGNTYVEGYLTTEQYLYYSLLGEQTGLYRVPHGSTDAEKISDMTVEAFRQGIFDGERFWYTKTISENEWAIVSRTIDPVRTEEPLYVSDAFVRLLATTETHVYFTKNEPVLVGYSKTSFSTLAVYNSGSRIYRCEKATGEVEVVLEDVTCSARMLYLMDGEAIIVGSKYIAHETQANSNGASFFVKIDENGKFTDLTEISR